MEGTDPLPLCSLPDTALELTLLFLSYDEISKLRQVNKRFNSMCKSLLNKGFRAAEKYHTKCLKEVKSKLPRRESERRSHPLSRHCDILTAIETRISLLGMTFMKYVDLDLCCFIPGKVIDEIFSVLRTIQHDKNPPRAYEILQELRDISSMAMEYFDERIVQSLKVHLPGSPLKLSPGMGIPGSYLSGLPAIVTSSNQYGLSLRFQDGSPPSTPSTSRGLLELGQSPGPLTTREIVRLARSNKKLQKKVQQVVTELKRQNVAYKGALETQNKKIVDLDQRIDSQNEVISQQNIRLVDQDTKLGEMNRRLIENEQKLLDLSAEKTRAFSGTERIKPKRPAEEILDGKESECLSAAGPSSFKKQKTQN